jgi:hypothetical protein
MIEPLTEQEKKELVNRAITQAYPKMEKDLKRITSYNHELWEDLLQFCLSEFLTKKPLDYQYKVCVTDNKITNYMGRSMSLNLRSNSSPFWHQYRKNGYNSRGVYLVEYENFETYDWEEPIDLDMELKNMNPLECVHWALEQVDFYHRALLDDYYLKDMTYKEIRNKYGIPLHHVRKDIEKGVSLLQEHCKHFTLKK